MLKLDSRIRKTIKTNTQVGDEFSRHKEMPFVVV